MGTYTTGFPLFKPTSTDPADPNRPLWLANYDRIAARNAGVIQVGDPNYATLDDILSGVSFSALDDGCKAQWRFETDLTADSQYSNTLSPSASAPTIDTTNYKEGSSSALFTETSDQAYTISAGALPADFPLKDANQTKISIVGWFRPGTQSGNWQNLVGRSYYATQTGFSLGLTTGQFTMYYVGGSAVNTDLTITPGTWYGVGLVADLAAGTYWMRVSVNGAAGITHTFVGIGATSVPATTVDWTLGSWTDHPEITYNGNMDNVNVFNRCLSGAEVDAVLGISGSYTYQRPPAAKDIIIPAGTHTLSATYDRIISNDFRVTALSGAKIVIPTGRTLTIATKNFTAGKYAVFYPAGTGQVKFSRNHGTEVWANWWDGCDPTCQRDSHPAIQAALDAVFDSSPGDNGTFYLYQAKVKLASGRYKTKHRIGLYFNVDLVGEAHGSVFIVPDATFPTGKSYADNGYAMFAIRNLGTTWGGSISGFTSTNLYYHTMMEYVSIDMKQLPLATEYVGIWFQLPSRQGNMHHINIEGNGAGGLTQAIWWESNCFNDAGVEQSSPRQICNHNDSSWHDMVFTSHLNPKGAWGQVVNADAGVMRFDNITCAAVQVAQNMGSRNSQYINCAWELAGTGGGVGGLNCESFWLSDLQGVGEVSLNNGGSGYTPGTQTLNISQGGYSSATVTATVSAGGVVTAVTLKTRGEKGYIVANNVATTGGGGAGCTVDITWVDDRGYLPAIILTGVDNEIHFGYVEGGGGYGVVFWSNFSALAGSTYSYRLIGAFYALGNIQDACVDVSSTTYTPTYVNGRTLTIPTDVRGEIGSYIWVDTNGRPNGEKRMRYLVDSMSYSGGTGLTTVNLNAAYAPALSPYITGGIVYAECTARVGNFIAATQDGGSQITSLSTSSLTLGTTNKSTTLSYAKHYQATINPGTLQPGATTEIYGTAGDFDLNWASSIYVQPYVYSGNLPVPPNIIVQIARCWQDKPGITLRNDPLFIQSWTNEAGNLWYCDIPDGYPNHQNVPVWLFNMNTPAKGTKVTNKNDLVSQNQWWYDPDTGNYRVYLYSTYDPTTLVQVGFAWTGYSSQLWNIFGIH